MAKWGEGDPRWIVEERPDGTNVNNWHWTEKNATGWSKEKLTSLLKDFKMEFPEGTCKITEITKLEGEAIANNRKAKLIFFYEWDIKLEWSGELIDGDTEYKGKIEIPNLSEENDADEIDVNVTINKNTDESYKVKELMRIKGAKEIRSQLEDYIKSLKVEYSQGMILPAKGKSTAPKTTVPTKKNEVKQEMNKVIGTSPAVTGVKIRTKTLEDKDEFKCQVPDMYRALTDTAMVQAFTRDAVVLECEKGGRFSIYGGNVTGFFDQLDLHEKLVMRWRMKSWPAEHYSVATITLNEKEGCTHLTLKQTGIPEQEYERTREGWRRYYWEAIKHTFGFGSRLF